MVRTVLAATFVLAVGSSGAEAQAQATFASPEEALQALVRAAKDSDRATLANLFGPEYERLLSGDDAEDKKDLSEFAGAVHDSARLEKRNDTKYVITVGRDNWPMPVPVVQRDGKWMFDSKAGLEEVVNRRIGEDELSAIATCRAYAVAQWEYYTQGDWDRDGVAEYAQKLVSTPGKHDGMYWETAEGDDPSPLGKLVAAASAEIHVPAQAASNSAQSTITREPYHGYDFKILTRQGPHAPGGAYSYIINGNMIAGYALVAYPDEWSHSGTMTFIINQQGRVYEKNLGRDTAKIVAAMGVYDPDPSWKLVPAEP
jgi:hypothetical protein